MSKHSPADDNDANEARFVTLLDSTDGEHRVEREIACMSGTIRNMLEDLPDDDTSIPLPNVTGSILQKSLEYCALLRENPKPIPGDAERDKKGPLELDEWETQFSRDIDNATLFELTLAANYLDIKPLLDMTCTAIAGMIKGKTPEQIRTLFNIKNDFTPEEEEQVRRENEWCE